MKKKFSVEQFVSSLAGSLNEVREPTEADLEKGTANTTLRLDPVDRAFIEGEAAHFGISIQSFIAMMIKGLRHNRLSGSVDESIDYSASQAAIQFTLETDEGMAFLRCWNQGDFGAIRDEWPEAPEEVFIGADPLHKNNGQPQVAVAG